MFKADCIGSLTERTALCKKPSCEGGRFQDSPSSRRDREGEKERGRSGGGQTHARESRQG